MPHLVELWGALAPFLSAVCALKIKYSVPHRKVIEAQTITNLLHTLIISKNSRAVISGVFS